MGDEDQGLDARPNGGPTAAEAEASTLEYANLVVSVIDSDIRHVHVRVTAALGLAAVFITQLPFEELQSLPEPFRWLTVLAIVVLVGAAVSYFLYTHELNKARIAVTRNVPGASLINVASDWSDDFVDGSKHLWMYVVGQVLLGAGAVAVGLVVARLLLGG